MHSWPQPRCVRASWGSVPRGAETTAQQQQLTVQLLSLPQQGADLVSIADTGSTDGTPEALRAAGADVHSITVSPWRFDVARNIALSLLPADCDLCLSLDLDEQLQPGWAEELRRAWAASSGRLTEVRHTVVDTFNPDGSPHTFFLHTKFHGRWNYTWQGPAHELPTWLGLQGAAYEMALPDLRVHQHTDPTKNRASYLGLLKLGAEEEPTNARRSYYYGRELFHQQQPQAAAAELERYLTLPGAHCKEERAAALRYIAQSELALGRATEAQRAAHRGVLEDGRHRESWLELARMSNAVEDWHTTRWAVTKALAITEQQPSSFGNSKSWGWWPHDLAAIAAYYVGYKEEALRHGEQAAALNPGDPRLRRTCSFIGRPCSIEPHAPTK